MHLNRSQILLLGHSQNTSLIPHELLMLNSRHFVLQQQTPVVSVTKESLDPNVVIQHQSFSQTTTPVTSAQQKATASTKIAKRQQIRSFFPQKWSISKNNMSPFSFCKYSHLQSLTNRYWYYLDVENNVQGPFSSVEMDNWYRKNLLSPELLISFKSLDLTSFIRLKEIIDKNPAQKIGTGSFKRSQSLIANKLSPAASSPSSKVSTEHSSSNTNSCQKQRPIWGDSKSSFQEIFWIQ